MMDNVGSGLIVLHHLLVIKLTLIGFSGLDKLAHLFEQFRLTGSIGIEEKGVMIDEKDEILFFFFSGPLSSFGEESCISFKFMSVTLRQFE